MNCLKRIRPNNFYRHDVFVQVLYEGLLAKNHSSQLATSYGIVGTIRSRCATEAGLCIEAVSDGRKGGAPAGY
jgi:hypothetical protein